MTIDDRRLIPQSVKEFDIHDAVSPLPTGTVTFLLTDIEGSTRLWEGAPDTAGTAVARHYAILDEAIGRRGGVRPVEQGEGDSVVAAFARASDAVAAAIDMQQLLHDEPSPQPPRSARTYCRPRPRGPR